MPNARSDHSVEALQIAQARYIRLGNRTAHSEIGEMPSILINT